MQQRQSYTVLTSLKGQVINVLEETFHNDLLPWSFRLHRR